MSCKARVVTKTANYTAEERDYLILGNPTSGDITITLPTAVGIRGQVFAIKNIHASNDVIIDPTGSETIDGASTLTLAVQYAAVILRSDGVNWRIEATHKLVVGTFAIIGTLVVTGGGGFTGDVTVGGNFTPYSLLFENSEQVINNVADTIDPNLSSFVYLTAGASSYTLNSTPTIEPGTVGVKLLILRMSDGDGGTVTLQRESALPGSGLRLGAATRAITGYNTLMLMNGLDGDGWQEVSFSTPS